MSSRQFSQTTVVDYEFESVFWCTSLPETNLWLHSCITIRGKAVMGKSGFIHCKCKLFKEQVYPRGMAVKVEDEVRDHRGLG